MVIIYSAPAVHIDYKCAYNLLARATYVPKNVVAAFRHVIFQRVLSNDINWCVTDGRTDRRMDGPTDGQTHPLIEMRERI